MQRKLKTALWLAIASMASNSAYGLGLGSIKLDSYLNEPLSAEIQFLSVSDAEKGSIFVDLASTAEFNRAGLDRPFFLNGMDFMVVKGPNGKPVIKVTTKTPITEPFLDFLVEVSWSGGRLVREYTLLLDPPVFAQKQAKKAPVVAKSNSKKPKSTNNTKQKSSSNITRSTSSISPRSSQSSGGGSVKVKKNDTLWKVSKRVADEQNVSVEQMMIAMFKANPDAFGNDNMNNLKAGSVMRVPERETVTADSRAKALAEIRRQTAVWRELRKRKKTIRVATTQPPAAETSKPNKPAETAKPAEPVAPTEQKRLALEGAEAKIGKDGEAGANSGGKVGQLQNQLAIAKEQAEVEKQRSSDLVTQLAEREERVERLEELIELRRQEFYQLQERNKELQALIEKAKDGDPATLAEIEALQNKPLPGATVESPELATEEEAAAEPEVVDAEAVDEATDETATTEEETTAVDGEEQAETAREEAVQPLANRRSAEAPKVTPKTVDADAGPFWTQPKFMTYVAGGLLVLILGLWAAMRRGREEEYDDEPLDFGDDDSNGSSITITEVEDDLNSNDTQVMNKVEPVFNTADDADDSVTVSDNTPLEEADVYLAYGQFHQAADVIKHAMEKEPTGHDYRLKLMEVYMAMEDKSSFAEEAETLQVALNGEHPDIWEKAYALGRQFYPDHALFSDPDATIDASVAAVTEADDSSSMPLLNDDDISGISDAVEQATGSVNEVNDDTDEVSIDLDFETEAEPAAELNAGLDFDIPDDTAGDLTSEMPEKTSSSDIDDLLDVPDLNLDTEIDAFATESESSNESVDDLGISEADLDLDLDLGLDDQFDAAPAAEEESLGFEVETDLDTSAPKAGLSSIEKASEIPSLDIDVPSISAEELDDSDGPSLEDLDLGDEVETKLDLAKAYMDMGDNQGAKDILLEVVAEGNESQKEEGQGLLDKIG